MVLPDALVLSWFNDLIGVSGQMCLTPEGHPALLKKQELFDRDCLLLSQAKWHGCFLWREPGKMVNQREKGLMYGLFNRALWFSLLAKVGNVLEVQK